MHRHSYILFAFLFFNATACKYLTIKDNINTNDIVASVGDVYLYKDDLAHLFLNDKSSQDSLLMVNNYIDNWAGKQILFQKATLNLSEEKQEELNNMLAIYKEYLYINTYKDALVSQNLDSLISSKDITDFYTKNQSIFILKENLYRIKYYRFKTKGNSISKIRKNFHKYSILELDSIYIDNLNFNETQLSDSIWIGFNDFKNWNPVFKKKLTKGTLRKDLYKEIKEKDFTYIIKVIDEKKRGKTAPKEQVTPIIKQMIIHKKRLEYINKLDTRLIEEAIKNNTYKRF